MNLRVSCDPGHGQLLGWSLSPSGIEADAERINTSLAKYTENDNTLTIHGVNASDGGVYRCVHITGDDPRLCILVHGMSAHCWIILYNSLGIFIMYCSQSSICLSK